METRLAAMEQLVGKENKALLGATNEPKNDLKPSNSEHKGSRNAGGKGNTEEERKNGQNTLLPPPSASR